MHPARRSTSLALTILLAACAAPIPGPTPALDPSQAEVPLPTTAADWNAFLVVDEGPTGIWTVEAYPVFPQYASPEVVGLDDRGQCLVCVSYSGKWTPLPVIEDGKWLGAVAHADVDPRIEGAELYVGGQKGNLFQVRPYPSGALDQRLVSTIPGRELHTLLAGELDPAHEGPEILVFTRPGGLWRVTPDGPHGTFQTTHLADLSGRVRDALVLPSTAGEPPRIATVSRAGRVEILRMTAEGPSWSLLHQAPMGKGRIALAPPRPGRPTVIYTTQDDGVILRHEETGAGGPDGEGWTTEAIYLGPQGPRGIAAGRFGPEPDDETLVIFGYSRKVQLLTRTDEGWRSQTLFIDRDKGHWLSAAELDGRNATDELLLSGYGGRIVMLARPPGYGREESATR